MSQGLANGLAICLLAALLFCVAFYVKRLRVKANERQKAIYKGSLINAIRSAIGITIPGISLEDYLLVDEGNDVSGDRITAIRNNKEDTDNNFTVVFWHETKKNEVKITKLLAEGDDATGYEIQRAFEYRRALKRGIFGQ